jgi:hypothetical protein
MAASLSDFYDRLLIYGLLFSLDLLEDLDDDIDVALPSLSLPYLESFSAVM